MIRLVVVTCAIAACAAQGLDPKLAKILKEQRFNAGDGRAGSSYATEDGKIFKEEISIDGSRIGQYSYNGPDGRTYTVKYSAGKDGFRILEGSHIPADGNQGAPFVEKPIENKVPIQRSGRPQARPRRQHLRPQPAPQQFVQQRQSRPQAQPQQQFLQDAQILQLQNQILPQGGRPQPARQPAQQQFLDYDYVSEAEKDPNFNPFINPNDPTHKDLQFNVNAANYDPKNPLARKSLVPPCADCEGFNPFVNPFDKTHAQQAQLEGHFSGRNVVPQGRPAPRQNFIPRPAPQRNAPLPAPSAPPKNFFPPGQLKLNRFETGFNFDFQS